MAHLDLPFSNIGLFRALSAPFKPIKGEMIANAILEAMSAVGMNTNIFKAHSTWGEAASKALDQGATVDKVMQVGQWSSWSVFNTFYNHLIRRDISKLVFRAND